MLPPHRSYDEMINLLPSALLPRGRLYPLSPTKSRHMDAYIAEALEQGFIRPSSSPAAAGFFFVQKKDRTLQLCIDYQVLNQATTKDRHPLPLVSTIQDTLS